MSRISLVGCIVSLSLLIGSEALANEMSAAQFSAEVGVGYEAQTSPLVRLSPQGELINIDGLQRLGGSHILAGIQGFSNWQLSPGWSVSLAGDASQKRAPGASDFDFGMVSVQPAVHLTLGTGSLGWGLGLQQIAVSGRSFREVRSTQVDWTLPSADGSFFSVAADVGDNRHPNEFSDLDSVSTSLSLQRHWVKPLTGVDALDMSVYFARERNGQDFAELSHRSQMLSTSMQWRWQDITWSAGVNFQRVEFDATAFAAEPVRVDRAVGIELGAELELSPKHTLRFEYSEVRSASTIGLYDNSYQQITIKMRTAW